MPFKLSATHSNLSESTQLNIQNHIPAPISIGQDSSKPVFQISQLTQFGLDPRDWLIKDIRSTSSFNRKLQHRDEDDIQLLVELDLSGAIKEIELLVL